MQLNELPHIAHPAFTIERNCSERGLWDEYVHAHNSSSNYHKFGWRDVIERSFGHKCFYFAARNNADNIVGLLPLVFMQSWIFGRFLVSLPFFNYGGLLYDRQEVGIALLAEAAKLQNELDAGSAELRHVEQWPGDMPTKRHKVVMIMDLADNAEAQWHGFNAKLRNQVRKAEKSGLTANVGGAELLPDFYTVFVRNMRDLGTPVYGQKFFAELLAVFPDHSRIIAVYHEELPIAAGLITWFRQTVEIPWASSIRDYNRLCPNNLLYWTALQYSLSNGFKRFDFGRSTPGEGTYKFKEQWGARPIQLNWQYILSEGASLPEINTRNPKYELAIKAWQKLPLPVTRFLGPHIVKNIP